VGGGKGLKTLNPAPEGGEAREGGEKLVIHPNYNPKAPEVNGPIRLPNSIFGAGATPTGYKILCWLALLQGKPASEKQIASLLGLSRRAIARWVKFWEEKGILRVIRRRGRRNIYLLPVTPGKGGSEADGYFEIPAWEVVLLSDPQVPDVALAVALVLHRHANGQGTCYLRLSTIEGKVGRKRRRIWEAISWLKRLALLERADGGEWRLPCRRVGRLPTKVWEAASRAGLSCARDCTNLCTRLHGVVHEVAQKKDYKEGQEKKDKSPFTFIEKVAKERDPKVRAWVEAHRGVFAPLALLMTDAPQWLGLVMNRAYRAAKREGFEREVFDVLRDAPTWGLRGRDLALAITRRLKDLSNREVFGNKEACAMSLDVTAFRRAYFRAVTRKRREQRLRRLAWACCLRTAKELCESPDQIIGEKSEEVGITCQRLPGRGSCPNCSEPQRL